MPVRSRELPSGEGPVAVLAAGGKTAQAVVRALAATGVEVRPLTRPEADLDSGRGLVPALVGCRAAWLAAPNLHPDEPGLVRRVIEACRTAGVPRLVYHSVAWPYAPAMPHHRDKAVAEDLVRRSGLRFTVLQPCAYLQNLVPGCAAGRVMVPYSLDSRFALVDLADVAAATAEVLQPPARARHDGATYELGGPASISVRELAALAERVTGRRVVAEQIGWDDWLRGPGRSVPPWQRDRLRAMFDSYDRHGFPAGHVALAALIGRPPADAQSVLLREIPSSAAGRAGAAARPPS